MRRGNSTTQFFREVPDNDTSRMWVNISGANGAFSQTVVGYTPQATLGYDKGIDGRTLGEGSIKLYSIIEGHLLAIQGRPVFELSDVVPLGYKAAQAGQYEFTLDHADGIFAAEQDMYIYDSMTGTTHNLRQGGYSFVTEAGTFEGRFFIVYSETLDNGSISADESVMVYNKERHINVSSKTQNIVSVTIYDMCGRVLYDRGSINSQSFETNRLSLPEGVILVKVGLHDNAFVNKRIIIQ